MFCFVIASYSSTLRVTFPTVAVYIQESLCLVTSGNMLSVLHRSLAAQVVTDSCQGALLKVETTRVLFLPSGMERSGVGLPGSLLVHQITLCAR